MMHVSARVVRPDGEAPSEPELGDEDVNVDDVLARVALGRQVAHGQLQYQRQRTNQRLHLTDDTWMRQRHTVNRE